MRRRWRAVKWAGAAACLCLVLAWLISGPWGCYVTYAKVDKTDPAKWNLHPYPNHPEGTHCLPDFAVSLSAGCMSFNHGFQHTVADKPGWNVWHLAGSRGWKIWQTGRPIRWLPGCGRNGICSSVWLPLWMPLLMISVATSYLFWRDRRISPHCCQGCGYDLTGNTSGVCPECGKKA